MRGLALIAALLLPGMAAAQAITAANYTDPTDRYGHRVLGAGGEWGALTLDLDDGTTRRVTLPQTLVFEDPAPRLADLDGDGAAEVIVVESSLREGARLTVYGPGGRIAYIDRPHLAQVLRVWRFRDGGLTHVADYPGLTNHKIGWDFIPGGIRHCGDAPEMITAVSGWSQVAATRFRDSTLASEAIRPYRGPEDLNAALACP